MKCNHHKCGHCATYIDDCMKENSNSAKCIMRRWKDMKCTKIILEGPDNAGKSTIGRLLAEKLGWSLRGKIIRVGQDMVESANEQDLARSGNEVLDRCYWLSDYIYEPVVADHKSVFERKTAEMEQHLQDRGIVLVFIHCSAQALLDRFMLLGDDIQNQQTVIKVACRYEQFFRDDVFLNYVDIDTTSSTPEECVEAIIKFLEVYND